MRRIQTKQSKYKKDKRNQIILSIVLVVLLVGSIIGYSVSSALGGNGNDVSVEEYKGLEFVSSNGYWILSLQGQEFYFSYLPQEVENISVLGNYSLENYLDKPLYFIESDAYIQQEVLINLDRYVQRYQDACLNNSECEGPIKDCSDNLIIYTEGDNKVFKQENCVYIQGDLKAVDAYLYRLFGII